MLRKYHWFADNDHKFKIDSQIIIDNFDKTKSLHFSKKTAEKEKETLLPFINIDHNLKVLDLGCGNGRWAGILVKKCKNYIGVDLSKRFIEIARKRIPHENASFICMPVQEYYEDEQYDLILLVGLLTYLNDEDIEKLSENCRKMLAKDGKLIIRNVTLKHTSHNREVYDYRPNIFMRLLGRPGYQLIRRSREEELSFFEKFHLLHEGQIEGTSYSFYVLGRSK